MITTRHFRKNNENGISIKPRSVDAIEKSITLICKKNLQKMGQKSYEIYKNEFSERVVYKSVIDIYKTL